MKKSVSLKLLIFRINPFLFHVFYKKRSYYNKSNNFLIFYMSTVKIKSKFSFTFLLSE